MLYKVSKKVKGTLILNSVKTPLSANSVLSLKGDDLYKEDIQAAIRTGVLVQQKSKKEEEEVYAPPPVTPKVMITNNLEKKLILGNITLNPHGSTYIPRTEVDEETIRRAAAAKYIDVVFEDEALEEQYGGYTLDEIETDDPAVNPAVWNFDKEELEDAPQVPSSGTKKIDKEEEEEDEEEEEEEEEVVIVKKKGKSSAVKKAKKRKKSVKRASAPKKTSLKTNKKTTLKKGSTSKTKKVKTLEAVGEVRPPANAVAADMDLDDRGKPKNKPGDTLQRLIEEIQGDDITFVDKEQQIERLKDRGV